MTYDYEHPTSVSDLNDAFFFKLDVPEGVRLYCPSRWEKIKDCPSRRCPTRCDLRFTCYAISKGPKLQHVLKSFEDAPNDALCEVFVPGMRRRIFLKKSIVDKLESEPEKEFDFKFLDTRVRYFDIKMIGDKTQLATCLVPGFQHRDWRLVINQTKKCILTHIDGEISKDVPPVEWGVIEIRDPKPRYVKIWLRWIYDEWPFANPKSNDPISKWWKRYLAGEEFAPTELPEPKDIRQYFVSQPLSKSDNDEKDLEVLAHDKENPEASVKLESHGDTTSKFEELIPGETNLEVTCKTETDHGGSSKSTEKTSSGIIPKVPVNTEIQDEGLNQFTGLARVETDAKVTTDTECFEDLYTCFVNETPDQATIQNDGVLDETLLPAAMPPPPQPSRKRRLSEIENLTATTESQFPKRDEVEGRPRKRVKFAEEPDNITKQPANQLRSDEEDHGEADYGTIREGLCKKVDYFENIEGSDDDLFIGQVNTSQRVDKLDYSWNDFEKDTINY
ncbi:hypothetical protein F5Y15DRAFT_416055 [Xylariaceae sp. FL0016]|nr:hypothetical protein F5Y15DRAFT_416055 [Xylariaceae sp. FL0016]